MLTQTDLEKIDEIVSKRLETGLEAGLEPIKKDIKSLRKDLNIVVSFFDNETLKLEKRVDRIEDHLELPPLS